MNKKVLIIAGLVIIIASALIAFLLLNREVPYEGEYTEEEMAAEHQDEELTDEDLDEGGIVDEDYNPDVVLTLEEALPVMTLYGYTKTEHGYQAVENTPEVDSVRTVNAKGNQVTVDLIYDYHDDNEEMIRFYKDDTDDAVSIMVSSFITRLAARANATTGTMKYTIVVGGKKVVKDKKMTLKQALKYQEMAGD